MQKLDTSKKLSEVVREVMRNEGTNKLMLEKRAEALWKNILGPTVNRATESVRMNQGTLYVRLTSSVVRQELFNMRGKIIFALNKAVGEDVIKEIRFL